MDAQNPRLNAIYKATAAATWGIAGLLFTLGLLALDDDELDYYAFGVLATLVAMTFTVRVALEHVVAAVIRLEAQRSRTHLADAVAEALAEEIEERGLMVCTSEGDGPGGVTPIR